MTRCIKHLFGSAYVPHIPVTLNLYKAYYDKKIRIETRYNFDKKNKKVVCFFQITKEHIAQFLSLTGNQFYIYASSFPLMGQHYELRLQYSKLGPLIALSLSL
jgi:hypothetical protein